MNQHIQQTIPGTPKPRGGYRPGAGRKKTTPDTVTLRVCAAVAEQCKAISEDYRRRYDRCLDLGLPMPDAVIPARESCNKNQMLV
jgi:hypothetical protein